jgi:hypothetical protein
MKGLTRAQIEGQMIETTWKGTREQQMAWGGLQLGFYGDKTLPECTEAIDANLYQSGDIVSVITDNVKVRDPTFWAREYGIKF